MNISLPFTTATFYNDPYVLSIQTIGTKYYLVNWTTIGVSMSGTATSITVLNNVTYPVSSLGTTDYESMVSVYTGSIIPAGASTAQGQFIYGVSLDSQVKYYGTSQQTTSSSAQAQHAQTMVCMLFVC